MNRAVRATLVIVSFVVAVIIGLSWALIALGWDEIETLRWDKPYWLLALVAAPVVLVLGTIGEDRRIPRLRVGNLEAAKIAPKGPRARLRDVPGVLRAASLVLIAVALARPQSL